MIFSLLDIEPCGCVIDFCDEKELKGNSSQDTAGVYTTFKDDDGQQREVILINSKHKNDTLAVGAILAHEMMHLYLSRLNVRLQDTQENELLTDSATINTGLSILILNGMSYSNNTWLDHNHGGFRDNLLAGGSTGIRLFQTSGIWTPCTILLP